jgi:hypothetical protein
MGIFKKLAVAAIASTAFAGTANAAQSLIITGPSGTYGDDNVVCAAGESPPCDFSRTFTFPTPTDYNSVSLDISSILNGAGTDINFTSVMFNGVSYNILSTGISEFRNLLSQPLTAGATNTITVTGTTAGNGAFSGTIALGSVPAVPEPATWGLMLLGFGAMGYSMRRRRRHGLLMQAA